MAAVATISGGNIQNTNSGTKAITVTPTVGDLLVLIAFHTGNTSAATPTDDNAGGGGTYTKIASATKVSSGDTLTFFIRDALITSGTSTIITHAPGTSSGGGTLVLRVTGMSKVGAAASVQTAKQDNTAAATPAPVLGAAAKGTNPLIGAVMSGTNPAALTKPATFDTEALDNGFNAPITGIEVVKDDTGNTDTTVTWGSATVTEFCSLVMELDASATVTGAAALTGTGSSTIAGVRTRLGVAALTGTGSSTIAGTHTWMAAAALTGAGSATIAGVRTRFGTAALSGQGSATAAGVRTRSGSAALSGVGSLTAAGTHEWLAAAALSGTGSLVASGDRIVLGAADLTGTGSETVAGAVVVFGAADLTGVGDLTATGLSITGGAALLTGIGSMVVDGIVHGVHWPISTDGEWDVGSGVEWPFPVTTPAEW